MSLNKLFHGVTVWWFFLDGSSSPYLFMSYIHTYPKVSQLNILVIFYQYHQTSNCKVVNMTSPGFSGAVRSSVTRPCAVADVITVKSNKLFAGLWRLLLFTELVVFPSALVLPQLPVSAFRPGDRWVHRKRELHEIYEPYSLCQFQHLKLIFNFIN